MSTDRSDSRGPPAATGSVSRRKIEKPPFKLCFSKQQEAGRSDACASKITASYITPKFYSREMEKWADVDVSNTVQEIEREDNKKPKDPYRWPLLTSHTYGWWHDRGIKPRDPRFNFHKKTSDLVSYQMRIYAEDRKLKGLGH
ncbi:uncharacterized protein LOC107263582 [Cephus cinctus]|uniref:Uncharacterized protein LOC107263582 n=1 Tax=Cephus cinctus TaxID=211228 RepID=A0AAJ7BHU2_CEPCN|nr:uncharacterized protein LOC107263582 [Cephus cinctus]